MAAQARRDHGGGSDDRRAARSPRAGSPATSTSPTATPRWMPPRSRAGRGAHPRAATCRGDRFTRAAGHAPARRCATSSGRATTCRPARSSSSSRTSSRAAGRRGLARRAVAHGWDVVPVIIQDPRWEQSFPRAAGMALPVARRGERRAAPRAARAAGRSPRAAIANERGSPSSAPSSWASTSIPVLRLERGRPGDADGVRALGRAAQAADAAGLVSRSVRRSRSRWRLPLLAARGHRRRLARAARDPAARRPSSRSEPITIRTVFVAARPAVRRPGDGARRRLRRHPADRPGIGAAPPALRAVRRDRADAHASGASGGWRCCTSRRGSTASTSAARRSAAVKDVPLPRARRLVRATRRGEDRRTSPGRV